MSYVLEEVLSNGVYTYTIRGGRHTLDLWGYYSWVRNNVRRGDCDGKRRGYRGIMKDLAEHDAFVKGSSHEC